MRYAMIKNSKYFLFAYSSGIPVTKKIGIVHRN